MAGELDDTTAAELGHALVRWITDEDPAGVARVAPSLDPSSVDDARATRIGHLVAELLARLDTV